MAASTSSPATRDVDSPRGMVVAGVVSIVVHLLLVLLGQWFPLGSSSVPPPTEEEIVFTFAPVEEDALLKVTDTSDLDVEDASFDTDTPRASPTPGADFLPTPPTAGGGAGGTRPAAIPEPVVPPRRETPAERPTTPPPDPDVPSEDAPEPVESEDPRDVDPAATLDVDPDAELLRRLREERARQPIDIDRAVRDFERRVQAYRESQPPPGPPGKRPANVFVPDVAAVENTGYGLGNLVFESDDYDWEDYGRQVYWAIWRAWHNRIYATTDEFELWGRRNGTAHLDDEVRIVFTILSNGEVTGIGVEVPSACGPLDLSATDALAEVILPPLPRDFPRAQETVHARFVAVAHLPLMRRYLRAMKARGIF